MIAATVQKSAWWHNLSFNWFDIAILVVLGFGFWRGRKHGMSKEVLPTSMWLLAVIGAGFGYKLLGDALVNTGFLRKILPSTVNERSAAYVTSYLAISLVVLIIHSILKKVFKEKVSGSNAFGGGEYYLGMIAGVVRYGCITVFVLALLNAPVYSAAQFQADEAYRNRWFGGGMKDYNGDFIPTFQEVQASVFTKSWVGPYIHDGLSSVLINTTQKSGKVADIFIHH